MFQAMFSPIIRSTWLYLQHLVVFTQVTAGWCHGWVGTHFQLIHYYIDIRVFCMYWLRLCTSSTAHRGCRGIALLFHDHDTRRGWGVSVTLRPLFTPGRDPIPIVQEAGWTPGPVWTGAENLASTGIRSPYRPARSPVAIPTELHRPTCLCMYV